MRALPNMTIIEPSGPEQLGAAVAAALEVPGPVYLRMKRPDGPVAVAAGTHHPARRGEILREGTDGTIVACGLMVSAALQAADRLSVQGKQVGVVNMPTIKPLDTDLVIDLARRTGVVVAAENHSVIGGLGFGDRRNVAPKPLCPSVFARVGVQDTFAEGGTTPYLQAKYGLTAEAIVDGFIRAAAKRASMQVNRD